MAYCHGSSCIACIKCGQDFIPSCHGQIYCAVRCRRNAERQRQRARGKHYYKWRGPFLCQSCGGEYRIRRPKGEGEKYCSRECAFADKQAAPRCSKVYFYKCAVCDKPSAARNSQTKLCGSDACQREYASARHRKYAEARHPHKVAKCRNCCLPFIAEYGSKRRSFCTDLCSRQFIRRVRGSGSHRVRAKRAGVTYEYVDVYKVFRRDGWRCQICGKQTPKHRRGSRYSNAPELDHRIPLSKGGGHTYANVQCTCRACNHAKSNVSEVGQYPLFEAA